MAAADGKPTQPSRPAGAGPLPSGSMPAVPKVPAAAGSEPPPKVPLDVASVLGKAPYKPGLGELAKGAGPDAADAGLDPKLDAAAALKEKADALEKLKKLAGDAKP